MQRIFHTPEGVRDITTANAARKERYRRKSIASSTSMAMKT